MTHLKAGDKAPDFTAIDQDGKTVTLSAYRGKKVVLYFYPKDNTPGCTAEACNLRDNYEKLKEQGYEIIGVSADGPQAHRNFIRKYDLPFTLLADTGKKIINDYGVLGEGVFAGKTFLGIKRTTFVISEEGTIERVISKVDTRNHSMQITE